MDEATRKELETCLRTLEREASRIRQLLNGDKAKRLSVCDFQHASISGVTLQGIVQKAADAQPAKD